MPKRFITETEAFPSRPSRWAPAWFSLHVDGPHAGKWREHDAYSTGSTIVLKQKDGTVLVPMYENVNGQMYVVYYDLHLITPIAGGNHYWLVERAREKYDGVL